MRKFLTAAVAALTLGGAMVATTAPAEARPYGWGGGYGGYHGYHYYGHGGNPGVAVAAGIAGLAVGAALASPRPYYNGYYGGGYGGGYYPGYAYPSSGYYYYPEPVPRVCSGGHWVWDPYAGRNIWVRDRYYC